MLRLFNGHNSWYTYEFFLIMDFFILHYYYYYYYPFSLFHNDLAGSQNSNDLTDLALLILFSAKLPDYATCMY
jgi:hypothetical protein